MQSSFPEYHMVNPEKVTLLLPRMQIRVGEVCQIQVKTALYEYGGKISGHGLHEFSHMVFYELAQIIAISGPGIADCYC